ncbi:hypothetical protein B0H11DRAFT_1932661 [Mycena galericulata]|nr:hypothetical protein B0H11DRAFT_1932661 [Mycena galericulata]
MLAGGIEPPPPSFKVLRIRGRRAIRLHGLSIAGSFCIGNSTPNVDASDSESSAHISARGGFEPPPLSISLHKIPCSETGCKSSPAAIHFDENGVKLPAFDSSNLTRGTVSQKYQIILFPTTELSPDTSGRRSPMRASILNSGRPITSMRENHMQILGYISPISIAKGRGTSMPKAPELCRMMIAVHTEKFGTDPPQRQGLKMQNPARRGILVTVTVRLLLPSM